MKAFALTLVLGLAGPLQAQHRFNPDGSFDPAVPTPASVLGYEVGDRFTPHHLLMRYLERVAAASRRVRLDTVATTFEGREVMLVVVASEANQGRLDSIRRDAQLVANPTGVPEAEVRAAADRLPAIVWLGFSIHGNEASGVEAAIGLLYQLAAGRDPETVTVLDSVLVLIDPAENPDGHERHVQDVLRREGALGADADPLARVHEGTWPGARTSHYHFDLNRDWFIQSHPESRGRARVFLRWWPHVAVDLHEQGSEASYFFAPPMEPINPNVPPSILAWWDRFAAANARAFDAQGWPYFRREGYDEFYPGYGVSWPILTGAVGMTYEQASSRGGAIRRRDGTVLTLAEAARHHYTTAWATLVTSARLARLRVRDYLAFRRGAVTEGATGSFRTVALERDRDGRADSLVQRLAGNGIVVERLTADLTVPATGYGEAQARPTRLPAGTYLVDLSQPQGRLAKALLEPDVRLDSSFIATELESRRTGQPSRFYDVTAWSLPYTFRVRAWTLGSAPAGREAVKWITSRPSSVERAKVAYAFEPGSEASLRMLAALLAGGIRVWYAPKAFTAGEASYPRGALLVRIAANPDSVHRVVSRAATETGARVQPLATSWADQGTDLGSNSVSFVKPPRVALIGGPPVSGNSFGFAWFTFDQRLRYPVTTVDAGRLVRSDLSGFDVIVLPSLDPEAFARLLGDGGRGRLTDWVRAGGTLVTMEGATAWLAGPSGLGRLSVRRDSAEGGTAPLPAATPGAIVRAVLDTLSPLAAGIRETEVPVMADGALVLRAPKDVRPGELVMAYGDRARLRLSGFLWPEGPEHLAGTPYLWTESVGRGRVVAFAGDPNFRDLWRGLLPLFANAVFLAPSS